MPAGVEVLVADGFATIDVVDPKLRGQVVAALLEQTPPEFIETLTRTGPRRLYRVPEGNAREAGLIDKASQVDALDAPDTSSAGNPFGAVPPEFPSTLDLHAQTVRSGSYASEYADGGVLVPGDGIVKDMIEVPLGETAETTGDGSGSALPDIDPSSYPPDAQPIEPLPEEAWSRAALNEYAAKRGIASPENLPNKAAVLDAIKA